MKSPESPEYNVNENLENEAPDKKAVNEEIPEFDEDKIDRVRLRTAIEIALEDDERPPARHEREKREAYEKALEREAELMKWGTKGKPSETPESNTETKQEKATQTDAETVEEAEEPKVEEEPEPSEPRNPNIETEGVSNEEAPQENTPTSNHQTYEERLTAIANEKDPLGLAKVALRETLDNLGVKESFYIKQGPFELLVAYDKLRIVRTYEEFKKKVPNLSQEEQETYLKGLIHSQYEQDESGRVHTEAPKEPGDQEEEKVEQKQGNETSQENVADTREVETKEPEVVPTNNEFELEIPPETSFEQEQEAAQETSSVENREKAKKELLVDTILAIRKDIEETTPEENRGETEARLDMFDVQTAYLITRTNTDPRSREFFTLALKQFLENKRDDLKREEREKFEAALRLVEDDEEFNALKESM